MSVDAVYINKSKYVGDVANLQIIDNCRANYYRIPNGASGGSFSKVGETIDNFITHVISTVTKSEISPIAIGIDKNNVTWLFVNYVMNTDTSDLEDHGNYWVKLSDIKYKFGGVVKTFIYRTFSYLPSERKVA